MKNKNGSTRGYLINALPLLFTCLFVGCSQAPDALSAEPVNDSVSITEKIETKAPDPIETMMPTETPVPTVAPTEMSAPTSTPSPEPTATSAPTSTSVPTDTPVPTATSTPVPTATNMPAPTDTPTPEPTATSTPVPTATNTPVPTATNTPTPTNTPIPTATSTPVPTATQALDGSVAGAVIGGAVAGGIVSGGNSGSSGGNDSNFNTYDNPEQQNTSDRYVLNTKSKKIHDPSCEAVRKISPENYATSNESYEDLVAKGYEGCGICFTLLGAGTQKSGDKEKDTSEEKNEITYVLNTNTKKIHKFDCKSAKKIKPENYDTTTLSISELEKLGYTKCGNCFKD